MTVYVHEKSGERAQPRPGGTEEARLQASGSGWRPETEKQAAERKAGQGRRVAHAHGTARVNVTGQQAGGGDEK